MGTFGGPSAYPDLPGRTMNADGALVAQADTSTPDPYAPNCTTPDCLDLLGFVWRNGVRAQLPSLGGVLDAPFSISDTGLIAGASAINTIDPMTGFPEQRAVIWKAGEITNLGTLPGGTESNAFLVNDQGLVAGPSNNDIPDPYGCGVFDVCWPNETRGFVWQNGEMKDMGTLGGTDTNPAFMNNAGQIAGQSFTNNIPNPATGFPTMDPFLWQNGHMQDLGTLGGAFGVPNGMNSRGEVVGQSDLLGDQTAHPFLWNGTKMIDLGTLGGPNGAANWVNDAGDIVGTADLTPLPTGRVLHHGFLWKNGAMTDLPPVGGALCSVATSVNDLDQAVGRQGNCSRKSLGAMLWDRGTGYNLNSLVAPTDLYLYEAISINDQGEIVAQAVLPNGDNRVVLLVPAALAARDGLTSNAPAPASMTSAMLRRSQHALRYAWRAQGYPLSPR
jgi:probable HAF family extracellular repeat protein